ncbi:MAG: PQQ-like beta-propeller repeat protein [Pirellulales bacterium]|nr:PQQ-like beta-propeller repeat protein [Pirellulales bacterium]
MPRVETQPGRLANWIAVALSFALTLGFAANGEDWPRWRGPRGDGTWQAPKLPNQWPAAGLPQVWKQPIGGGYAGIVVADGRTLTMDRQTAEISTTGAEVERVLCYEAATGKLLWQHAYPVKYGNLDYGNGPRAAPTLHAGRVYTLGAMGHALCLDAASGKVLWSKDFVGEAGAVIPEWGLAASPVIFQNLVVYHPGAKPDGCYVALDQTTGNEVWRAAADAAGYATPIVIEYAGEALLVAWTPLHVLGIAPATGEVYWSVPYEVTYGVSIATPVFHDGVILVTGYWEGSKAIELGASVREAKLLWEENRYLRGLMSQPLTREGLVYSLDKSRGLTCFEMRTGKVLWNDGNRLTPRGRNPQASLVWLGDGNRAMALNSDGELVLARLNRDGYHEESRVKIVEPTWAHPALAGDLCWARGDNEMVCVRLTSEGDKP